MTLFPLSDPEVFKGARVGDRPVGGGAGLYGADQRDGRLVPRYPG